MKLGIKKLYKDSLIPERQTQGSVGYDVHAYCPASDMEIQPQQCVIVPCGICLQIPQGYDVEIRPRSGLSSRHLVIIPNSPGTIDSDYRGEIRVPMMNLSQKTFIVSHGMRIAQMVLRKSWEIEWVEMDTLAEAERGNQGFGSTGI